MLTLTTDDFDYNSRTMTLRADVPSLDLVPDKFMLKFVCTGEETKMVADDVSRDDDGKAMYKTFRAESRAVNRLFKVRFFVVN